MSIRVKNEKGEWVEMPSIGSSSGGGTSLPVVTEQDNGKVLKAQSGKWVKGNDETAEPLSLADIDDLLKNFT